MKVDSHQIAIKVAQHVRNEYGTALEEAKERGGLSPGAIKHIMDRHPESFYGELINDVAEKVVQILKAEK